MGDPGIAEEGLDLGEVAGAGELKEDGVEGDGVVGDVDAVVVGVLGLGVVEDLEGEVWVVLAGDEGGEGFWGEAVGPGMDWGRDGEGGEVGGSGGGDGGDGGGGGGREGMGVVEDVCGAGHAVEGVETEDGGCVVSADRRNIF